jgi:hypothetical protein
MSITHYRIYCNDHQRFVNGYGSVEPTKCYLNEDHDINPNSVQLLETFSTQKVMIDEEYGPNYTGGYFGVAGFDFVVPANSTIDYISNFPFPIAMLLCEIQANDSMIGDKVDFISAENTTVGVLTQEASSGTTTVTVSPSVIKSIYIGLYVRLTDGTNANNCGRIISTDTVNLTVTFETPTINDFAAGSYFQFSRYFVKNYTFGTTGNHKMGSSKIGGGYIPANINGICRYTNTSDTPKKIAFSIEYLY